MAWVITRACADCVDTSCVTVCPVDCIYELTVADPNYRKQLFIAPDECIDCALCEPECPWEAIYHDRSTPDVFEEDIAINKQVFLDHPKEDFTIYPERILPRPRRSEIEANLKKWGFERG
jgi:ferredoxin